MKDLFRRFIDGCIRPKRPKTIQISRPTRIYSEEIDPEIRVSHPDAVEDFEKEIYDLRESAVTTQYDPVTSLSEQRNHSCEDIRSESEEQNYSAFEKDETEHCSIIDNTVSAPNNGNFDNLKLIKRLLRMQSKIEDVLEEEDTSPIAKRFVVSYIDDVIVEYGAKKIDNENEFDPIRHTPESEKEYPRNVKIEKTKRFGLEYNGEVLRAAIVIIKENN